MSLKKKVVGYRVEIYSYPEYNLLESIEFDLENPYLNSEDAVENAVNEGTLHNVDPGPVPSRVPEKAKEVVSNNGVDVSDNFPRGFPDFLWLKDLEAILMEVKMKSNSMSKSQKRILDKYDGDTRVAFVEKMKKVDPKMREKTRDKKLNWGRYGYGKE